MPAPRKADARTKVFRFRINDAEDERFRRLAKERGVERADLIREVLGLALGSSSDTPLPPAAVPAARPDPKSEPGAAALTEVAERIQRKRAKKK